MELVRWRPWHGNCALDNQKNDVFGNFVFPTAWFDKDAKISHWQPTIDAYHDGDRYVVKAELPGVEKDDIDVQVKKGILTISGKRSTENEVKENHYYRKERVFGKFSRSFALPETVDTEHIEAEYKNGLLTVTIPKAEIAKPRQITVH